MTVALLVVSQFLIAQIFVIHRTKNKLFSVLQHIKKIAVTFQMVFSLLTVQIVRAQHNPTVMGVQVFYQQASQVRG